MKTLIQMNPERAEHYLRKNFGKKIETGCIREACESHWIPHTRYGNTYQVNLSDVIKRYIK